jgi:hypothetical protein
MERKFIVSSCVVGFLFVLAGIELFVTQPVIAQTVIEPLPANISIMPQPDSPILITLTGVNQDSLGKKRLGYSVRNVATKNIRTVVIAGIPGAAKASTYFGTSLTPGGMQDKQEVPWKGGLDKAVVSVDFVLFEDGTTWGPDTLGESQYVIGVFDGQKDALADIKALFGSHNEGALKELLISDRNAIRPAKMNTNGNPKWQDGYTSGYRNGVGSFQIDYRQGGLSTVPRRIEEMERDLGLLALKQ